MSWKVVGVAATMILGLSGNAQAADKFSEAAACKMVMSYVQKDIAKWTMGQTCRLGEPLGKPAILGKCEHFESIAEQGWAKIDLAYTYFGGCKGEAHSSDHEFKFQHFDQGWKLVSVDHMEP